MRSEFPAEKTASLCSMHYMDSSASIRRNFELSAITVDLGFEDFDLSPIQALCQELNIPYRIESSDIYEILFHVRKESNPCSLCAKMRKGALNQAIKEMGCNKIAYAHHKDDIIETMLLSLIFEDVFIHFLRKPIWTVLI